MIKRRKGKSHHHYRVRLHHLAQKQIQILHHPNPLPRAQMTTNERNQKNLNQEPKSVRKTKNLNEGNQVPAIKF